MKHNVIEIAENIKLAIGVNVFEKNRTQPIVDVRSMYCYLLRKDLNFTLYQVRDIFKSQGKNLDHSSVHHNVILFESEVKFRRPELDNLRNELLGLLSPKYKLLKLIEKEPEHKLQQLIEIIEKW